MIGRASVVVLCGDGMAPSASRSLLCCAKVAVRSRGLELLGPPHPTTSTTGPLHHQQQQQLVREQLELEWRQPTPLAPADADGEAADSSISGGTAGAAGPGQSAAAGPLPRGVLLSGRTGLVGRHQHDNVAAALATVGQLRLQGWDIPDAAVTAGLEAAFLPGRFQVGGWAGRATTP